MKTIEVNLQNIHDIYNEFNIKTVNDDFENYVLKQTKNIGKKEKACIQISCKEPPSKAEKEQAVSAIKANFQEENLEIQSRIKKFYIIGAVLFLIGCLFLIPIHFLHVYNAPEVISVIFEIVTWVFIWEFVECVTFRPFNERIRKGRVDKILKGEIIFK